VNRRYLAVGAAVLVAVVLIGVGTGGTGGQQLSAAGNDPPANPWESNTVTVTVVDETTLDRGWEPIVTDALSYWNQNMTVLGYDGQFRYTENPDADVTIRVVDDVSECGGVVDPLGCAPVYTDVGAAVDGDSNDERDIEIAGNLRDDVTTALIKHELGHTLGVNHVDQTRWSVMRPRFATPQYDAPNATEVPNPWDKTALSVYYSRTNGELTDRRIRNLETARSYYDAGAADFLPANVSIERTTDPDSADIKIRIVKNVDSGMSRWEYQGYDPDDDGALEDYISGTVYIEQSASPRLVIWHAGHGIGQLFGIANESELPPPFDESKEFDPTAWKT
jgi:hypothetical protein